jgi:hypothetical protein
MLLPWRKVCSRCRSIAIRTTDLHHFHIAASLCGLKRHQQQVSTATLLLHTALQCRGLPTRADTCVLMVYWKAESKARQHAALRYLQRTRDALGRGRCHVACPALPGRCRACHAVARSVKVRVEFRFWSTRTCHDYISSRSSQLLVFISFVG